MEESYAQQMAELRVKELQQLMRKQDWLGSLTKEQLSTLRGLLNQEKLLLQDLAVAVYWRLNLGSDE